MKLAVALVCLCVLHKSLGLRLAEKLAKDIREILNDARTDHTVRRCLCDEQHVCFEESKHQTYNCLDECWSFTKQITNSSEALKSCLTTRKPIIDNFFSCLETNLNSCTTVQQADNITYTDYKKVINDAEDKIKKQVLKLTKSVGSNASKLVQTLIDVASCTKTCFLRTNSKGFCFDAKDCQPQIDLENGIKSFKKCAGMIKWKETAGELCECAVGAGVNSLQQYCSMLKTIERGRSSPKLSTS